MRTDTSIKFLTPYDLMPTGRQAYDLRFYYRDRLYITRPPIPTTSRGNTTQ